MEQIQARVRRMNGRQRRNLALLILALLAYGLMTALAPRQAPNPLIHTLWVVLALSITIIGLLIFAWVAGFYAWFQLDRFADFQPDPEARKAYRRMAMGVGLLLCGLILSSLISAAQAYWQSNAGITQVIMQLNYFVIVLFPFFGFLQLRVGSRHLSVLAAATMSVRMKLLTVGPPVTVLAAFYIFLMATNSAPSAQGLATGPLGFLFLPFNVLFVVGSWVLGLLAALNIERATYRVAGGEHAQPFVKLYNGVLTTTGGFIILDALMSLGASRLLVLPVGLILVLIYAFIGVVALGFFLVAMAGRALVASTEHSARKGA